MFATALRSDCSPTSVCTTVDLLPLLGEGRLVLSFVGECEFEGIIRCGVRVLLSTNILKVQHSNRVVLVPIISNMGGFL